MAPAKDGTNRVILTSNGGPWTPTTVPWEVGVWQKWTLEYTANATNFKFSVDGIEGTASATAGLANNVYFYNGDWVGSGWFGLDSAPAQIPAAVSGGIIPTVILTVTGHVGFVQWQNSADCSGWNDIPGATSTNVDVSLLYTNTPWFRAQVSTTNTVYTTPIMVSAKDIPKGTMILIK